MGAKGFSFFLIPDSSQSGFLFFEIVVKGRSAKKKNAENAQGLGIDRATFFSPPLPPFPKSRVSYFRFARFNTSALCYLRAWHRLRTIKSQLSDSMETKTQISSKPVW